MRGGALQLLPEDEADSLGSLFFVHMIFSA